MTSSSAYGDAKEEFPFHDIRYLLIDIDGVLKRGDEMLPAANRFIDWLRERQIGFRLVSNNATRTPGEAAKSLASSGIPVAAADFLTSAIATALYLHKHDPEASVYVVGQEGLHIALQQAGIRLTEDNPDYVVVGLDRTLTYEKLARASLFIEKGARFIGTNPDTSFPTERGLEPGAGALLAALTAATGKQPLIIGKPEPFMLELAMQQLGGTQRDTAVLGDRLDTDIFGAERLELASILVLTGVSTRDELKTSPIKPDLIVSNLSELMKKWGKA